MSNKNTKDWSRPEWQKRKEQYLKDSKENKTNLENFKYKTKNKDSEDESKWSESDSGWGFTY